MERSRDGYDATIQGAGGEILAEVNLIHRDGCGNANVNLIAAAPDLLSALRGLLGYKGFACDCGIPESEFDAARAAIAKAEGES